MEGQHPAYASIHGGNTPPATCAVRRAEELGAESPAIRVGLSTYGLSSRSLPWRWSAWVRRRGESAILAQVYNESDGFDARHAASLDAELNIRDGQGKVKDCVNYFQNAGIDKATANARGILARTTGKRAYTIATQGDAELIAAYSAGKVSDEAAVQIAAQESDGGQPEVDQAIRRWASGNADVTSQA